MHHNVAPDRLSLIVCSMQDKTGNEFEVSRFVVAAFMKTCPILELVDLAGKVVGYTLLTSKAGGGYQLVNLVTKLLVCISSFLFLCCLICAYMPDSRDLGMLWAWLCFLEGRASSRDASGIRPAESTQF